jgi:hypothetical protein
MSKTELKTLLDAQDWDALLSLARERSSRVVRYLLGRLASADQDEKLRAVEALGRVVEDEALFDDEHAVELMRRLLWALNDESGAVPFGMPEAIGELCVRRPELRVTYVPILGSFLTDEEMLQTGPIERGVVWALGRLGPLAAELAPHGVEALVALRDGHAERETRAEAEAALARICS